jgi:hypothetical protein
MQNGRIEPLPAYPPRNLEMPVVVAPPAPVVVAAAPMVAPAPLVVAPGYAYPSYVYPGVTVGYYPAPYAYRGYPRYGWRR